MYAVGNERQFKKSKIAIGIVFIGGSAFSVDLRRNTALKGIIPVLKSPAISDKFL